MDKSFSTSTATRPKTIVLYYLLFALLVFTQACEAQTVYITKTGEKYHVSSCQYLRYSKFSITLTDAQKKGYTACSVCKPPLKATKADSASPGTDTVRHEQKPISAPAQQPVTSKQCSATTKAGSRCKRMTTSASGRCWQHE